MAGQINRSTKFGELIFDLAKDNRFKTFLEIGTWNGQGSTRCFLDGLGKRDDDWSFYSLESNKELHDLAKDFWSESLPSGAKLIHGRIVDPTEIPSLDELSSLADFKPEHIQWYECDVHDYDECENVYDLLPDLFDVVLLDGGEFSTYAEYNKIKDNAKNILLDDTNMFKCNRIANELKASREWSCVVRETEERNGFAFFKRED